MKGRSARGAVADASLFLKAVTDSSYRLDIVAVITQLLTQADDLHVDRALGHRIVIPLHTVDDLAAGECPTRLASEELQQPKLGEGQIEWAACQKHFVPAG